MRKAILMAAGRGTRISRNINDNCKCTLDIGGTSLIRHTVELLLSKNIEIHLIVGYNKERIFSELKGLPVVFHENVFYSITNSIASLWFARNEFKGESLILGNADVFWEDNLLSMLFNEERDCVMLSDSSHVEQGDYLLRVENGEIKAFGKGMDCKSANCEYVGLSQIQGDFVEKCRSKLIDMIEKQRHHCWWEQILYDWIPERPIWSRDVSGHFWAEIDYIEDYNRILNYIREKERLCQ